jgi:hypothetical protein
VCALMIAFSLMLRSGKVGMGGKIVVFSGFLV